MSRRKLSLIVMLQRFKTTDVTIATLPRSETEREFSKSVCLLDRHTRKQLLTEQNNWPFVQLFVNESTGKVEF